MDGVFMQSIFDSITKLIQKAGDLASLLILVIMAVVTYEVVSRYVFNTPTSWAWLINKQLFGVFVLIAGGFTLVRKSHIRIEMLYERSSPAYRRFVDGLSLLAALLFLGSLLWKSTAMGLEAWETKEVAMGVFKLPLYPLKLFIPVGALLFILGCIATAFKSK
jgi:TRAP-type mannitol/chloroaromatic compound transport system permease small subunit